MSLVNEVEQLVVSHEIKDINLERFAKLVLEVVSGLPDGTFPKQVEELLDFANNILKGRDE